jgi:hypothetical protein
VQTLPFNECFSLPCPQGPLTLKSVRPVGRTKKMPIAT